MLRRFLLLSAGLPLLGACMASSQIYEPEISAEKVSQIQKGVSTRQQVEALIGQPMYSAIGNNGERMVSYQAYQTGTRSSGGMFTFGAKSTTRRQNLQVIYTQGGVVKDLEFSEYNQDYNSTGGMMNSRTTVTPGPSKQ